MSNSKVTTRSESQSVHAESAQRPDVPVVSPAVDVIETDDKLVLLVDLPGVKESDVDVSLENGRLDISAIAQRNIPEEFKPLPGASAARRFVRQFRLSDAIDTSQIEATLSNGLMTIALPKADQHRRVRVAVKSAN